MKTGKTLIDLATEIERQLKTKKDYVVPTSVLSITPALTLKGANHDLGITNIAHQQFATYTGIPKQYYDKMKAEQPALLADNLNVWLKQKNEKRLIRTLDGNCRSILSDHFRPLDNYDLLQSALPAIQKSGCCVESCEVTESRLYLKCVTDRISTEVSKGDVVQAGIMVSNSEVGMGSLRVEPLIFRLICLNGMIAPDYAMRKYHVGGKLELDDGGRFYSDATRNLDAKAFFAKVRDTIQGVLTSEGFNKVVESLRKLQKVEVKAGNESTVIEDVSERLRLSETESGGLLRHFTAGGIWNAYRLVNAVTRLAQDSEDYDRSTELERIGGEMTAWKDTEWTEIGMAA